MAKQRILACPLCGETQYEQSVCKQCAARLDPDGLLLAEASFGPWYLRDEDQPFSPGMTYDILIRKVRDGVIENYTLLRGPTTRQHWKVANRVPGIAHLLGRCHACREHIDPKSLSCTTCGEAFGGYRDRNNLGLDKGDPPKVEVEIEGDPPKVEVEIEGDPGYAIVDEHTSEDIRNHFAGSLPKAKQRILACPLCGETQYEQSVCKQCAARLDPDGLLLAEASYGPWYLRDEDQPFSPGMTYDILIRKVRDGVIENYTLLRGPTTRQLWKVANRVPGIAHLLGRCHACREHIDPKSLSCTTCGEAFGGYRDRNNLGLDKGDPPKVEVDGVSSFIGDTAIYDTTSEPIQLYSSDIDASDAPVTSAPEQNNDAPGTPAFRSLQRRLEGVQRTKRILIVALGVTGLGLLLAVIKIF